MSEAELLQSVRDLCKHLGILCYHTHDSRRSEAGFPDLVIVGTRLVFAELKSMRGPLRPEQRRWGCRLQAAGQAWYVWRPVDWQNRTIEGTLKTIARARSNGCIVQPILLPDLAP